MLEPERRVELDGPVRRIFAIPQTTAIVAQAWNGRFRVLETRQGDWLASFDGDDARATSSGLLQILVGDRLEVWSLPEPSLMRWYDGEHGFTDVAWSHDGRSIGAASGGAQVHRIHPFEHRSATPAVAGHDVIKSISARSDDSFVAVGSLPDPDLPAGLLRFEEIGGAMRVRALSPDATHHTVGRRVEVMRGGHIALVTIAMHLGYSARVGAGRYEEVLFELDRFFDLDTDSARELALATGERELRLIALDGTPASLPTVDGARYGSIHRDGRYALAGGETLWIFGADGERARTIEAGGRVTALEWRDGTEHVFTGHADGTLRVWEASTAELVAEARVHRSILSSIDISPDDALVATSSWDTTVRILSLEPL